jgi:arsenate reductase
MSLTVYSYAKCSTCRKALAWLERKGIAHQVVPIVEAPPSASLLARVLRVSKLPLKALFNTSGESYRAGGFKERLPKLSEKEALEALSADGKLIKRPLLVADDFALVGFDEAAWQKALAKA